MTTRFPSRALVLASLAACGIIGGYSTMIAGSKNGFFEAIGACARGTTGEPYIPGGPAPFKTSYTGISAVDNQLLVLVTFFATLIDGEKSWAVRLSLWYLMVQLWAGWSLLSLEGLRKGNRGRVVSWTGTMGIIFQNISYTITVPIYLMIHLLTSPLAQPTPGSSHLFTVDDLDLKLLPLCTMAALVIPSIAMALPSPSYVSASTHYTWIAIWQAFPLWQTTLHWTLKRILPSPTAPTPRKHHHQTPTAAIYKIILLLSVASQSTLLLIALTPPTAVPEQWRPVFSAVTVSSAFVPAPFWTPPTTTVTAAIPADALPPLAHFFLQWDVYCGGAAVLLWAVYLRRAAGGGGGGGWGRALGWGVLGGPVAAAAVLLWERDEVVGRRGEGKGE